MSLYWFRRLLTAAIREGLVFYAATAGERLAKRHISLKSPTTKRRVNRKTNKRKK